jgi:hypothetical protein
MALLAVPAVARQTLARKAVAPHDAARPSRRH